MRYTSTCILNHRFSTRFRWISRLWWIKHEHPDVHDVAYDDNGDVALVWRRTDVPGLFSVDTS